MYKNLSWCIINMLNIMKEKQKLLQEDYNYEILYEICSMVNAKLFIK